MANKKCTKCGDPKPLNQFNKAATNRYGVSSWCKLCARAQCAEYERTHKKQIRKRRKQRWEAAKAQDPAGHRDYRHKNHLWTTYRISWEKYARLFEQQGGCCAICCEPETARMRGLLKLLCVDHDHVTGRIRRLLCSRCNRVLGMMQEDPETFRRAADYLESFT